MRPYPGAPHRDPIVPVLSSHGHRLSELERRIIRGLGSGGARPNAVGGVAGTFVAYFVPSGMASLSPGRYGLSGAWVIFDDGGAMTVNGVHLVFAQTGVVTVTASGGVASHASATGGANLFGEVTTAAIGGLHYVAHVAGSRVVPGGTTDLSALEWFGSGSYAGPVNAGDTLDFEVDTDAGHQPSLVGNLTGKVLVSCVYVATAS